MPKKSKTKSTTGTSNTVKSSCPPTLSVKNVKDLIKLCSKNRVSEILFLNLSLKFQETEENSGQKAISDKKSKKIDAGKEMPTQLSKNSPERSKGLDEGLLEDMRKAQLMIDDPISYEKEVIDMYIQGATGQ